MFLKARKDISVSRRLTHCKRSWAPQDVILTSGDEEDLVRKARHVFGWFERLGLHGVLLLEG